MTVPVPGQLTYSYDEDGVTTVFAYPVRFLDASELVVVREVGGIQTTLVLNTDYTVSGAGSPSGGSITRAAATDGGKIIITRNTAWKQIVDLSNNGRNPAESVEQQLDRLTMAGQDANERLDGKADAANLAPVAFSGDYDDLENKPFIPPGTVTSVALSAPNGFSVGGSPVTGAGTLSLSYSAGYQGYTTAEANKLGGIASQATKNQPDAYLLSRANHTGDQPISTISGLQSALDAKADKAITISAGAGLSGGGSLAANRTIALSAASQVAIAAAITAVQPGDLGTASAADVSDFATAVQGALADSAVQPGDLGDLATKDRIGVLDIDASGTPSSVTYLRGDGVWAPGGGGGGGGDVFGPSSATDGEMALFDGASGKLIKGGGLPFSGSFGDLTGRPSTYPPSAHSHDAATTSVAGFMSAADKSKLNGIATGATANDTDANLKNRANHTGTQPISTIAGLQAALDSKQADLNKQISIELGFAVSSSQPTYIDFHTLEGPSDFAARIIRNVGANGRFDISNTGTGPIGLYASGGVTINGGTAWHSGNFTPANYLPLAGGTMTGPISFGSATGDKLLLYGTTYGMAVLPSEFAMWASSTAAFRWRWNSSAGPVGAELTSAGFKLPTATPTDNLHAVSKQYVDAKAAGWTELSPTATTSGTAIDWTSIPTTVTDIELWFNGVSTNGTDHLLLQIGTGGSPTTSGYSSGSGVAGSNIRISSTAGMIIYSNVATYTQTGIVSFHRTTGDTWVSSHSLLSDPISGASLAGGGAISLAGALNNIRLRTPGGTATFDAGSVQVRYR